MLTGCQANFQDVKWASNLTLEETVPKSAT